MLPKHVRYQTALHPGSSSASSFPQATSNILHPPPSFVNTFLKISTTFFFLIQEGLGMIRWVRDAKFQRTRLPKRGKHVTNKTSPEPRPFGACFVFMEMRGVEPLSEGSLAGLSTGVVCDLKFPHPAAHRRAARVSSFMLRVSSQSFDVLVPRVNDGGNRTRGQSGPPSRH